MFSPPLTFAAEVLGHSVASSFLVPSKAPFLLLQSLEELKGIIYPSTIPLFSLGPGEGTGWGMTFISNLP